MIPVVDVLLEAMPVVTTAAPNAATTLCAEASSSEGPLSHRSDCTPEQTATAACMHGGTCYLTPFQRPGCACPSEFEGLRCEQRALDIDIGSSIYNLKPGEYVAIGAVIATFVIIALITVFLIIRYRRQRSRYQLSSNLLDHERPSDEKEPEKEDKKPQPEVTSTLLPDSQPSNNNHLSMPRPPSRGRLSAVGRSPSEEDNLNALTVQPEPEVTEVITGV